ncbi:MAG: double-strand break repair helicase AddA [Rhodobacteraceae bacterium]|nr:double-strand break repair helicase AddA [Paracoccaceae bacterium]
MRDAASENQVRAADPGQSTWLSANAGSGKTRVLTDRVARLLLGGTEPQRILCLTYTKAAASEMQIRLFGRLGEWAMLPEDDLRAALRKLGVDGHMGRETLADARRLFARAIETPGGLKIQTIHSFAAALLRRFPIEAGVSPDFAELDDRASKLLRGEVVEEMAAGDDIDAVDAMAGLVSGDEGLDKLLVDLCKFSDDFQDDLSGSDALGLFGLAPGFDRTTLFDAIFTGGEAALLTDLVPLLLASSANDVKAGVRLATVTLDPPDMMAISTLENVLLYGEKAKSGPYTAKIGAFPTMATRAVAADLMPQLEDLMRRVENGRLKRLALDAAAKAQALHRFAAAFLPRYAARKSALGVLDFDDLIDRAARLLSDNAISWILYRLDGGIDHVLVDEAQDTSPGQWRIIERLTEEFTAGDGARAGLRTIFVVGDKKQSIYSFQGADLAAYGWMYKHFLTKYANVGVTLQNLALEHSFRSSEAILRVVDLTFDERVNRGLGGAFKHVAYWADLPGRVDLWPAVERAAKPESDDQDGHGDIPAEAHHTFVLARRIAAEIRRMIDSGTRIATKDGERAVHAGDFLILVQQRQSPLFNEIIRACKSERLDIAGADRLRLGGEIAVKDIAALLRFLSLPEDDLSLAAALRSPLFGWSEGALYDLAEGRADKTFLWAELRRRAADFAETVTVLQDLRNQAEFLRPYELVERILTRHDGRRRLLARLGPEAEEGIDALLYQALAFEQAEVPSLTGLLVWLEADDVEIKRRLDTQARAIRVMTVHGAKGLEAPIVILPDTAKPKEDLRGTILPVAGKQVWKTRTNESPPQILAARATLLDRQREEKMRLLYVAMTRAQSWLIVAAAGDVGEGTDSWYSLIRDGMEKAGAIDLPAAEPDAGPGRRVAFGNWPEPAITETDIGSDAPDLPGWASTPGPIPETQAAALPATGLGGAKALPGEEGRDEEAAKRYGSRLHLLLEHLPRWPEQERGRVAGMLLQSDEHGDVAEEETALLMAEAMKVLAAPDMAALLGPDALREVELTARLPECGGRLFHGTIDCLVVSDDHILAVDYKSNAVVPDRADDVPEGLLRQLGVYDAMLRQIYPDRRIETGILWTRAGRLMRLHPDIVRAALQRATIP